MVLPNGSESHLICSRFGQKKRLSKEKSSWGTDWAGHRSFLTSGLELHPWLFLGLQVLALAVTYHHGLPWGSGLRTWEWHVGSPRSPACWRQILGLLAPPLLPVGACVRVCTRVCTHTYTSYWWSTFCEELWHNAPSENKPPVLCQGGGEAIAWKPRLGRWWRNVTASYMVLEQFSLF